MVNMWVETYDSILTLILGRWNVHWWCNGKVSSADVWQQLSIDSRKLEHINLLYSSLATPLLHIPAESLNDYTRYSSVEIRTIPLMPEY